MNTKSRDGIAVYTLRVERSKLERLGEIAATEHRSTVQKIRQLIDDCIAAHDEQKAAA